MATRNRKDKRGLRGIWEYNPYPPVNDPQVLRRLTQMNWVKTNTRNGRLILSRQDIESCLKDPDSLSSVELDKLFKLISYEGATPVELQKEFGLPLAAKRSSQEISFLQVEVIPVISLDGFKRQPFAIEDAKGELVKGLGKNSSWANLFDPRVFVTFPEVDYLSTPTQAFHLEPEKVCGGARYSLASLARWYIGKLQGDSPGSLVELEQKIKNIIQKFLPEEVATKLD